jgi:small subunit ribosomal protein S9
MTGLDAVDSEANKVAERAAANDGFDFKSQGITHARPYPISPSYFSREPRFNDSLVRLTNLAVKYRTLPTMPASVVPRVAWKAATDYRISYGEKVKGAHFAKALALAKRLNRIEPNLVPEEVAEAVDEFKRDIDPFLNVPKEIHIDKFGRAIGVGRRKSSVARAWVVEGTGEVQINGKTLSQAFGRVHDRESAVWALRATERMDKYNVWALVEGGGTTGQAEALTLAVAKALVAHEPALKAALRKGTCEEGF